MITISNLKKVYTARGMEVHALEDVSLHVSPGEIFGI
ncbi:MAG: DL-methionine transporter ATP-binding subunit, partial [Clostridia bacterium]|nr:DL-methionine transporter ATP-binding subunit [Clostridia bacterium]